MIIVQVLGKYMIIRYLNLRFSLLEEREVRAAAQPEKKNGQVDACGSSLWEGKTTHRFWLLGLIGDVGGFPQLGVPYCRSP